MRRAVITGLGAVSCIGNNKEEILQSLQQGRSGIVANETFKEMGLRSQVSGSCNIDFKEHIDRKVLRFMGEAAANAYIAMQQSIDDAGLEESDVSNVRTGRHAALTGRAQDRSLRRDQDNGQHGRRMSRDTIQDQGHQLLDYLSVCDQRTLYRRGSGANRTRQAGCGVRWRR
jgi:3-oxoacyl-(acyl-carrier-protein) synthase